MVAEKAAKNNGGAPEITNDTNDEARKLEGGRRRLASPANVRFAPKISPTDPTGTPNQGILALLSGGILKNLALIP
jgi:hypothetical protein